MCAINFAVGMGECVHGVCVCVCVHLCVHDVYLHLYVHDVYLHYMCTM